MNKHIHRKKNIKSRRDDMIVEINYRKNIKSRRDDRII